MDPSEDVTVPNGGWSGLSSLAAKSPAAEKTMEFSATLAMAASLLLAFATFEMAGILPCRMIWWIPCNRRIRFTEPTHFAPHELPTDVSAFEQVSKVFDGRAGWVLVSGDASDMGSLPGPIAAPRKVLLLRLSTSPGVEDVSEADLMIIPGQTANLKVPFGGTIAPLQNRRLQARADSPVGLAGSRHFSRR